MHSEAFRPGPLQALQGKALAGLQSLSVWHSRTPTPRPTRASRAGVHQSGRKWRTIRCDLALNSAGRAREAGGPLPRWPTSPKLGRLGFLTENRHHLSLGAAQLARYFYSVLLVPLCGLRDSWALAKALALPTGRRFCRNFQSKAECGRRGSKSRAWRQAWRLHGVRGRREDGRAPL